MSEAHKDAERGTSESPKETMERLTRQFNQMSELERAVMRDFINRAASPQAPAVDEAEAARIPLLALDHKGMRVEYSGMLKQARGALARGVKEPALAEMLRQLQDHITELGKRWYAGDTAVVDELLQLYCVEKGARDALVAKPECTCAAKDMPFGRCCKSNSPADPPLIRQAATVPLTDEQAQEFADWLRFAHNKGLEGRIELVRAIEREMLAASPAAESKTLPRESEADHG